MKTQHPIYSIFKANGIKAKFKVKTNTICCKTQNDFILAKKVFEGKGYTIRSGFWK